MGYREHGCDLCGKTEAVEVPHAREYTGGQPLHICVACGLVYLKQRRSPDEVAASWSEQIFGDDYTARIPAVKARHVFVAEFIDVHLGLRGKEVCDIGTGEGQFLEIIRREEYGALVFGTEATGAYCETLRKAGIRCFNGTAEKFVESAEGQAYRADIVTMMWTLECSASSRNLLSAAYRLLREGGHVVVATGSRILVPFRKPLGLYLRTNPADTHPVRFSAQTLRGILAVSGFDVIHESRYLDTDWLCMIGRKAAPGQHIPWQGDDYRKVEDFFERWHAESRHYR